ncbi:MAG: hypothetical protein RIT45_3200 [Pseudomonadota bacterium]
MRSLAIAVVAALAASAWAYMVWQQGERRAAPVGEVEVIGCGGEGLWLESRRGTKRVRVRFEGDGATLEVQAPHAGVAPAPGEATPTTTRAMAASTSVRRLADAFTPLRARRSLGAVAPDKLASLGLEAPTESLTVHCDGRTTTLQIGDTAYGGAGRYARSSESGEVFLLTESAVADVRLADVRFVQRALLDERPREFEGVTITRGTARTGLRHLRREQPGADLWVREQAPDRRDEMLENWVGAVLQLRALEHLGRDREPGSELQPPESTELVWTATFARADGAVREVVLRRTLPTPPGPVRYYARSDATRGWVTLSAAAAQRVADDLPALLGLPAEATATR